MLLSSDYFQEKFVSWEKCKDFYILETNFSNKITAFTNFPGGRPLCIIPGLLLSLPTQRKIKVVPWSLRCPMKKKITLTSWKDAWTTQCFLKTQEGNAHLQCHWALTHFLHTSDTSSKTLFSQCTKDHHIWLLTILWGKEKMLSWEVLTKKATGRLLGR